MLWWSNRASMFRRNVHRAWSSASFSWWCFSDSFATLFCLSNCQVNCTINAQRALEEQHVLFRDAERPLSVCDGIGCRHNCLLAQHKARLSQSHMWPCSAPTRLVSPSHELQRQKANHEITRVMQGNTHMDNSSLITFLQQSICASTQNKCLCCYSKPQILTSNDAQRKRSITTKTRWDTTTCRKHKRCNADIDK